MKKRVLSFILVLATLIGVLGTASISSMAAPTNYQQGDSRWGGIYYGKWNLAESGCGILSTVNAVNYDASELQQSTTVFNNTGSVLPSTGGIGTTMFYVIGGALVVCAAVLLVTRKRMSVEK